MALFNHATKEVTAKLVYYGPGLCGKTTNLQWIHGNLSFKTKGKLVSLATQTDRTLFFDFLPVELGTIRGMRTRMQIYTVPGQVFYESTRRMVLKGCDAVVFVADSQAAMLDANAESLRSLRQNLLVNEIDPEIPQVIQYNKRDLPTALPISVLNERLNPRNLPYFEAVAFKGTGVEDTLKGVTKQLFRWLSRYYGEGDAAVTATEAIGAPATEPAATPVKVTVRVPHATVRIRPEEGPGRLRRAGRGSAGRAAAPVVAGRSWQPGGRAGRGTRARRPLPLSRPVRFRHRPNRRRRFRPSHRLPRSRLGRSRRRRHRRPSHRPLRSRLGRSRRRRHPARRTAPPGPGPAAAAGASHVDAVGPTHGSGGAAARGRGPLDDRVREAEAQGAPHDPARDRDPAPARGEAAGGRATVGARGPHQAAARRHPERLDGEDGRHRRRRRR